MPSVSEKQRKFFGAELGRKKHGEKTDTGMSEDKLKDFASKPVDKRGGASDSHHKSMRHKHGRGSQKA